MIYPLPKPFPLTSGFNDPRAWGKHAAADEGCPDGTDVYAAEKGIVRYAGWGGNAGNLVEIEWEGLRTRYAHLQTILVGVGDRVSEGTKIGKSGHTTNLPGGVGPHLHWAVWFKDKSRALQVQSDPYETQGYWAVDPRKWLKEGFMATLSEQEQKELLDKTRAIYAMLFDEVGEGPPPPTDTRRLVQILKRADNAAVASANADKELDQVLAKLQ
jgi:murein DD-endopeptidase MepM/ murein hydrolase activator NlpD